MNSYQKNCLIFLQNFTQKLDQKNLSEKYQLKYIELYLELNGTKQRIKYLRISELWSVHIDTARNIVKTFMECDVLRKSQQTDENEDTNRGYLFLEPLVHPQEKE
jgi:hypothetical protein